MYINTFNWNTLSLPNTDIATAVTRIPTDLKINDVIRAPFNTSLYWRGRICLRFQVVGTPMHQGALLLYFKPNDGTIDLGLPSPSINDAIIAPSVILYANQSTPACLEIPFCVPTNVANTFRTSTNPSYYNYALSKFSSDLGSVYAKVIVKVDSQTTLSVPVSVHAVFKDIEFYVPRNATMAPPAQFNAGLPESSISSESMSSALPTSLKHEAGVLAALAVSALPSVGKLLRDGIDRVGKKLFNFLGLDKPSNPLVTDAQRMTTTTNFNATEGPIPLDRLTLMTSHVTTADATTFPTEFDEMDMSYILRKEQFIANFTTNSLDVAGKCLFSVPMGPMCVPFVSGINQGVPIQTQFSMMTKYWRGSMKFHFKFAMSDMQVCKLLFVKAYGIGKFSKFPTVTDLVNYDTESYEVNKGGQEIVITCNYNAPNEMCFNNMDLLSSTLQHGQLFVYLIQPLSYPQSCLNYITASVYISCGDDFSYYGPAEYQYVRPYNLYEPATFSDALELQLESGYGDHKNAMMASENTSEITMMNQNVEETTLPSTNPSHSTNTTAPVLPVDRFTHNMAPIRHIRDMGRRYYQTSAFTTEDVSVFKVNDIFRNLRFCSILTFMSNFYHVFKGGLRFRLVLPEMQHGNKVKAFYKFPVPNLGWSESSTTAQAATIPARLLTAASFTYVYDIVDQNGPVYVPLLVTINQVDSCLDFEITIENPFRYNVIHQASRATVERDIAADLGNILIAFPPDYVGKQAQLYVSLADESRFGMLMHNAPIYIHRPTVNSDIVTTLPSTLSRYFFANN